MAYDPKVHHRRSLRLTGYDYSQSGAYFITICTENRECLLGQIANAQMTLNLAGAMVQQVWDALPDHFLGLRLDQRVIMPNHLHGIIFLVGAPLVGARRVRVPTRAGTRPAPTNGTVLGVGAPLVSALPACEGDNPELPPAHTTMATRSEQIRAGTRPAPTIGDIAGAFKSIATHEYTLGVKNHGWPRFAGRLWQRNYYEHIIRNDESLNRIREYIATNPLRWEIDRENPLRTGEDEFDRWLATFKTGAERP